MIEEENNEKIHFIEDIHKIKIQMNQERRSKEDSQSEVRELRNTLKRVQE